MEPLGDPMGSGSLWWWRQEPVGSIAKAYNMPTTDTMERMMNERMATDDIVEEDVL